MQASGFSKYKAGQVARTPTFSLFPIPFEKADPAICGDQFSGKGEWQASFGQVKGCDMIRATLLKLKAWLSPEVASSGAKAKGHSSVASAQLAESAKKTKRRAQRQARARNR